MKRIGIIGGGFSGSMTAVHLIKDAVEPIEIIIVNERETFNKGIAFKPYSRHHLLNVVTAKMSAFADQQDHFLNWAMQQEHYADKDRNIIANSFLPRHLYGEYLVEIWKETTTTEKGHRNSVEVIEAFVVDLTVGEGVVSLLLSTGQKITVDSCVIASGNQMPRNPSIKSSDFFNSPNYFQNPWDIKSVVDTKAQQPILIVGNGLTMVDTVLGLLENNFEQEIYAISPNGFNILPHRHNGLQYPYLKKELTDHASLFEIVKLFNKHMKLVREFGLSAEPIVDSLRPDTQQIWQRLTLEEKKLFMFRLRHLWGVARHRIPLQIHDRIQQLRIDKRLHIYSGQLTDMIEDHDGIRVEFYNKKLRCHETLHVSRVINCSGPETDLTRLEKNFLKNCLRTGVVTQDELRLGINADVKTFQVIRKDGTCQHNLYTIGTNLKGVLWETTAVNELRQQAQRVSRVILESLSDDSFRKDTLKVKQ